jgi:hypothetical protein
VASPIPARSIGPGPFALLQAVFVDVETRHVALRSDAKSGEAGLRKNIEHLGISALARRGRALQAIFWQEW